MRINREILLKIAKDTVERESRANRDILSAYLIGSLLESEPLLGGATDIDLVFIWNTAPPTERTIQPLTEQVHLDIAHHSRTLYRQARRLRQHPWLGQDIARAQILFDPQHFMDFTQASVRGLFDKAEYVLERAQRLAEQGRQSWLKLVTQPAEPNAAVVAEYLSALENTANAVASLIGPPITERRFLLVYKSRINDLEFDDLYPELLSLLGLVHHNPKDFREWVPVWLESFTNDSSSATPPTVLPGRSSYYSLAIESLLETDTPESAIWPLLRSWTRLATVKNPSSEAYLAWEQVFRELGFLDDAFGKRLQGLDEYLDKVEEALEEWGKKRGVW